MARQVSGEGFTVYFDNYDTGEIDTLDFATVETTRHSVIRRDDGATVAAFVATWGDANMVRLQGSGSLTAGMIELAHWRMTDAADAADAAYEIVPPIG
jgi:hypothetical protein